MLITSDHWPSHDRESEKVRNKLKKKIFISIEIHKELKINDTDRNIFLNELKPNRCSTKEKVNITNPENH